MKTSNYFAKLPQEASIKSIQTFRDYDLITLNLPAPRQRLCPRCGSTNCVIKDSGAWRQYAIFLLITEEPLSLSINAGFSARNVIRLSMKILTGCILLFT